MIDLARENKKNGRINEFTIGNVKLNPIDNFDVGHI
jgi:hypothetical protein